MNRKKWRERVPDNVAHRRAGGRRRWNAIKRQEVARRRGMIRRKLQEERSIDGLIIITTIPADASLPRGLVDYLVRVTGYSKTTIKSDIRAIRSTNRLR